MRFYPGVWDLFGGHIEGKESPEDALRREAMEELGDRDRVLPSCWAQFMTRLNRPR